MDVLSLDLSRSAPYGGPDSRAPRAPTGRAARIRERLLRFLGIRGGGRAGGPPDDAVTTARGHALQGYTAAEILLGLGLVAFVTVAVPLGDAIASAQLAGTALAGTTGGVLLWTMFGLMGSVRTASAVGGSVHFTFHLPFVGAAMILGGPTAGAWVALLSTIDRRELESQPWYGTLANHAAIATAAVLGGLTYMVLLDAMSAATGDVRFATFAAIIVAGFVLEVVASGLALVTVKLRDELTWAGTMGIVLDNFRREMLLEVALIWVLVLAFASVGWWAPLVVGVVVIWYVARDREEPLDRLSGLMRKATFTRRADRNLGWVRRGILPGAAIMFIDLNGFHLINNRRGYEIGDVALQVVSQRMQVVFPRREDLLSRLMGDEFGVFLTGMTSTAAAIAKADELIAAVSRPIVTPDGVVSVGAAIGIVMVDDEGIATPSARVLLVRAVEAMHLAKLGPVAGAWHVWSPGDPAPVDGKGAATSRGRRARSREA